MFSRRKRDNPPKPESNRRRRGGTCPTYTSGTIGRRGSDLDRRAARRTHPGRERSRIPRPGRDDADDVCPVVDKKEQETKLHVKGINLHIPENVLAHHTDQYECTEDRKSEDDGSDLKAELVIRRGQTFKMTVEFNRPYDIEKNDLILMFRLGDDYKPCRRLNASFKVQEKEKTIKKSAKKWGAALIEQKDNFLTLNVYVPYGVPVGEWELSIRTVVDVVNGKDLIWQYDHTADNIKILFNPWCEDDTVYMADEKWREETVLNDAGAVYMGSFRKISAKPWNFGQFDEGVLDIALHLLRKGFGTTKPAMGSASTVSRVISTIVNSSDDDGVLWGNWSGNYDGGVAPTTWTGSVKILKQYVKNGCQPVKYGQCWVFSAVTTTVCRAIGLPCRSVTNHSSAHNTDLERISIDVFRKRNRAGRWVVEKNDSIWNFHVWNECWFRCPNLNTDSTNYDGWQAIDATPQEQSGGVFCCGPAPVTAIKQGHIDVGYDTPFVFAEVNADKVEYRENPDTGRLRECKRHKSVVGKCVSTHKPTGEPFSSSTMGSFFSFFTGKDTMEREDLTEQYKYPEGSQEERDIYRKTDRKFRQMAGCDDDSSDEEAEEEEPVDIDIEEAEEEVYVGNDFSFNIKVKNRGTETRHMTLDTKVLYKTYYDTTSDVATEKTFENVTLKPGDTEKFSIKVTKSEANKRPQDGFNFELVANAEFQENDHVVGSEYEFRLRRPDLEIKGPDTCKKDQPFKVEVSFRNPLDVPLTRCNINCEGPFKYVGRTKEDFPIEDILPGQTWKTTLQLQVKKPNQKPLKRCLTVGLESKQLCDISGCYNVKID